MSGLWSFREAVSLSPACPSVVRSTLPTAANDHDDNDDHNNYNDDEPPIPPDLVELFGTVADIEGVVRDAQAAWLARTVGAAAAPSSGAWLSPEPPGPASGAAGTPPDAEDIALARALLRGAGEREKRKCERRRPVATGGAGQREARRGATSPCAFVRRMERRAAQRREARAALDARHQERQQCRAPAMAEQTTEVDIVHTSASSKDAQENEIDSVMIHQGVNAKNMRLMRWYFVLWVAVVEISRERRAKANRTH